MTQNQILMDKNTEASIKNLEIKFRNLEIKASSSGGFIVNTIDNPKKNKTKLITKFDI